MPAAIAGFISVGVGTVLCFWLIYHARESSIYLSRRIDRRFALKGSIRLISDAIYLVLQIPVMLIYCSFLKQQIN